jgi:hypothetical protein
VRKRTRGGRPQDREQWARLFATKWREVEERKDGRRPTQQEMADALVITLNYLKEPYRAVIGVPWKEYRLPEIPHLSPLPDRLEESA